MVERPADFSSIPLLQEVFHDLIPGNGTGQSVNLEADTPLLWVLRDHLKLTGTKFGCGEGLCGACTVLIGGHQREVFDGGILIDMDTPEDYQRIVGIFNNRDQADNAEKNAGF